MLTKKLSEIEINGAGIQGNRGHRAVGMDRLPGICHGMGGTGSFHKGIGTIREICGDLFVKGRVSRSEYQSLKTNGSGSG